MTRLGKDIVEMIILKDLVPNGRNMSYDKVAMQRWSLPHSKAANLLI